MKNPHRFLAIIHILMTLSMILAACNLPGSGNASNTNSSTGGASQTDGGSATIVEVAGRVEARASEADTFAPANPGDTLPVLGQVQTGADSRARMDFADGTILRVGPSSLFTLTAVEDSDGGLVKNLQLAAGKLWVILNGGSLNVDSASGTASVRGSYMAISFNPITNEYWITCLEGTCTLQTNEGEVTLGAGESATVQGIENEPESGEMDEEDVQDWLDNNPEAAVVAEGLPGSIGSFVWYDTNSNGLQDAGEFGAPDVTVVLYDGSGAAIKSTITSVDGYYFFINVPAGDYSIAFIATGAAFTLKDAGDDALDSDADPASGFTDVFSFDGTSDPTRDAGLAITTIDATPTSETESNVLPGPPVGAVPEFCYGPEAGDFPSDVNPLSGMPMENPGNLNLPAVLVSVSNFPVSARPQSGLSYAPLIYEVFIGEGMTRFMTLYYGDFPQVFPPANGDLPPNLDPFVPDPDMIQVGNKVWLDQDENGYMGYYEPGIPGVQVDLISQNGTVLDSTVTNLNGAYGFNVDANVTYTIQVHLPPGFIFTAKDAHPNDLRDSDVYEGSGLTDAFMLSASDPTRDAGLILKGHVGDQTSEPETSEGLISIGDQVWLDGNGNGIQDGGEYVAPNVEVQLFNYENNVVGFKLMDTTHTDANGNYLFANLPLGDYRLVFIPYVGYSFTKQNLGNDDNVDSDTDPNGVVVLNKANLVIGNNINIDAGLSSVAITGGIGPVRSGRLPYGTVRSFFPGSCLVYAGKSEDVDIPSCASVFNKPPDSTDINDNYLGLDRLQDIAESLQVPLHGVNYSGNQFCTTPPGGGTPVSQFVMFYNLQTLTKWVYDPISGGWLRYHDLAEKNGEFYPSTDKATGNQLIASNVIVLLSDHQVLNTAGTIIDIDLNGNGALGKALLFRNGMVYDIYWTTANGAWEKETGQVRPIKFVNADGSPVPLAPGNTWVHVVTPSTCIAKGLGPERAPDCVSTGLIKAMDVMGLDMPYIRFFSP